MIQAVFHKDKEDKITSFKVEGHAGYAPSGRDVVCSAVSALVVGTVNGLEVLTDATFETSVSHGFTKVNIKEPTAYSNVLLNSMLLSLEGIQEEYPENIEVEIK
ncbi:ribosomal-processing cysteine protease Prp [Carnobacterium pleistocenium]|uniref:ribosomal-processing cysteine protease Prp n=1 Tax=Carnobacterium pleistocenium TaxID=181073 RepID=UPI00055990E1|nr:ribosomal-processing cysteine protease Prp [Carnobacterium pleistocenium]